MKNFFLGILVVMLLVVGTLHAKLYYQNYLDIPPNHPNSPYAYLFPGLSDINPSIGIVDMDQFLAHHFLFVVGGEEGTQYELFAISRRGCSSFTALAIDDRNSLDLAQYLNKAVLVRDYVQGDQLVLKELALDPFVNEHFADYQQACDFPFSRLTERFILQ